MNNNSITARTDCQTVQQTEIAMSNVTEEYIDEMIAVLQSTRSIPDDLYGAWSAYLADHTDPSREEVRDLKRLNVLLEEAKELAQSIRNAQAKRSYSV
jgi:hypothetical protein